MKCRRVGAGLLLGFALCREAAADEASGESTTALPGGTPSAESTAPSAAPVPAESTAPSVAPTPVAAGAVGVRPSETPPAVAAPYTTVSEVHASAAPRRWYGWQIIIADVTSSVVLVTLVHKAEGYTLLPYLVLAPSVHVANGNPVTALASVGLRVGMPIVGLLIGAAFAGGCNGSSEECLVGPAYGMLIGMVGAMVVDASVLAYDEPRHERRKASTLAPTVAVDGRGARIGLAGSF